MSYILNQLIQFLLISISLESVQNYRFFSKRKLLIDNQICKYKFVLTHVSYVQPQPNTNVKLSTVDHKMPNLEANHEIHFSEIFGPEPQWITDCK